MPLHDLGYRRWTGQLNPQITRWYVIAQAGIRLAMRSRWLMRLLVMAWVPAALCGTAIFLLERSLKDSTEAVPMLQVMSRTYPQARDIADIIKTNPSEARSRLWPIILLTFFRIPQGVMSILLVALIAPPLIAQDLRSRAYLLYFSRPITRLEYITGKMAIVATFLALVTILPGLALYVLGVAMSPDLSVIKDTWDIPIRVVLSSCVMIVPMVTFSLALSALLAETRYATFCWFAPWVLGFQTFLAVTAMQGSGELRRGGMLMLQSSKWAVISPYHSLGQIQSWIFGIEPDFNNVAPSALLMSTVTLVSLMILLRKVSAPMRV